MRKLIFALSLLIVIQACSGGYSFTGGSVGEAETINVNFIANKAAQVNPSLSQQLTEQIKDIFVQQTPLELTAGKADLLVEGFISDYRVQPISAQSNETTSQSRFTITIQITFTNFLEPDKSYQQSFSRYRDYNSTNLFGDVEQQLVGEIIVELSEDVMNRAIANW